MIIDHSSRNENEQRQNSPNFKEFQMGERIKKVTTHDLFQFKRNNEKYVAKLFKPEFRHNYELQLSILRKLSHQNIVQLVCYQSVGSETMGLWNCDILILKQAKHGSLNQYIPMNGRISQEIARVFFKQMISALKYASEIEPNGIIHPNLLPSSVLLDSERKVKICGWSVQLNSGSRQEQIKHLLFNCCEILLLMITSYMPFFKKHSLNDPLYKFVKAGLMEKFWKVFEKRVVSKYKQFQFSVEVKELIQKVFLEQWTTFDQIKQSQWMKKNSITNQKLNACLSHLENDAQQKREDMMKKHVQKQQKKKQIITQFETQTLRGSSNRGSDRGSGQEYDFFIQDFYDNFYNKDVPASQCSELIRVYDNRPSFVIAFLKQSFRNCEGSEIDLIFGEEFKLASSSVEKHQNQVYINLKFSLAEWSELDDDGIEDIRVQSLIRFFKNNSNYLFAEIKILESNLSQYYANLIMTYLQTKIRGESGENS